MNLLMKLQVEKQTSYLFITHDLSAVQHLSDVIAVVYLGHVMEMGDATTVLTPPFHPYTEALLSAVPLADPDVKQKPIRLSGSVPSAMNVPSGCRFHPRCPRYLGDICASRSRRGARAKATTASTVTSRWTSWRGCRPRRSSSTPKRAPDGQVHPQAPRVHGADRGARLDHHLLGDDRPARRRGQPDPRPLRHGGGQERICAPSSVSTGPSSSSTARGWATTCRATGATRRA